MADPEKLLRRFVRVIGCAPPYPSAGWPTSSHLIGFDDQRILLDCGHGAVQELLKHCSIEDLTAVVISHMHPDHWFDLAALRNVCFHRGITDLTVALPIGGLDIVRRVGEAINQGETYFEDVLSFIEYDSNSMPLFGTMLSGDLANNEWPARMPRLDFLDGGVVAYTGDTGLASHVGPSLGSPDLLIVECNDVGPRFTSGRTMKHLNGGELGALLAQVTPKVSLVTHYDVEFKDEIFRTVLERNSGLNVVMASPGVIVEW